MKNIILIFFLFSSSFVYSQFKRSSQKNDKRIFLVFEENENAKINHYGNVKGKEFINFLLYKHIPKEKYIYSLSYDKNNNLVKGIKGANSCMGSDKERISLIYNSLYCKKKTMRLSKGITHRPQIISTKEIESLEFATLQQVISKAEKIYILIKQEEEANDNTYVSYQIKGCK